jgi:MYXO-CTERM domain-containing protein
MRYLLPIAFLLVVAPARADGGNAEAEQAWAEVQKSSTEALASQDCRLACRALESLQRATKRLCDIGPEHCEEARAKLRDATQRVRTTCPECEVQTNVPADQPKNANMPPPSYGGGGSDTLASESAPQKSGGCAGCNTSTSDPGIAGLVVLAVLALRRKKKPTV